MSEPLQAQAIPPEVARFGYADTIFINGKVVSMDDKSNSTQVGNVYQALAVKGDKIVKLGGNQDVRALAGPDTRVLDLKGRTLIPGIIEPHMHIYGEAVQHLERFGFTYPPNGVIVNMQAEEDLEKTQAALREKILEAVQPSWAGRAYRTVKPGRPQSLSRNWGCCRVQRANCRCCKSSAW